MPTYRILWFFLNPIHYPNGTIQPSNKTKEELDLMEKNQQDFIRRIRNLLSNILNNSQWPQYAHEHKNFRKSFYENPCFLVTYEKEKDVNTIRTTRIWLIFHEELRLFLPQTLGGNCEEFICTDSEQQEILRLYSPLSTEELESKRMDVIYAKVKRYFRVPDKAWLSRIINLQKWAIVEFNPALAHYSRTHFISLPFFRRFDQNISFSWIIIQSNQQLSWQQPNVSEPAPSLVVTRRRSTSRRLSSSRSTSSIVERGYSLSILSETTNQLAVPFASNSSLIDAVFAKVEMIQNSCLSITPATSMTTTSTTKPISFQDLWIHLDNPEMHNAFIHKLRMFIQQTIKSSGWAHLARKSSSPLCREILFLPFYDVKDREIHVWLIFKDQLQLCREWMKGEVTINYDMVHRIEDVEWLKQWCAFDDINPEATPRFSIPWMTDESHQLGSTW